MVAVGRNGGLRRRHCGSQTIALWVSLLVPTHLLMCVRVCGQWGLAAVATIIPPTPPTNRELSIPRLRPPHHETVLVTIGAVAINTRSKLPRVPIWDVVFCLFERRTEGE